MKTLNLLAIVNLHELNNVPNFEPTKTYAVISINNSHSKFTSKQVDIVNNKGKFPDEPFKFEFKSQTDKNGSIQTRYLQITFFTKISSNSTQKPSKLGNVNINLIDFIKSDNQEVRFLLENSKSNAIIKLSIVVKADDGLDDISLPISHFKNFNSTIESTIQQKLSKPTQSPSISCNLPMGSTTSQYSKLKSASTTKSSPIDSKSSMASSANDTHSMMTQALNDLIGDEKSNEILNKLFNKTYRFTWQLQEHGYDEFTPIECIKDIVERNGNGWKKNDEGFDMIDIVQTEYWDRLNNKKRIKHQSNASTKDDDDDDDEWAEFDVEDETSSKRLDQVVDVNQDDDNDSIDDDEYYDLYNPNGRGSNGLKKSYNHRVKPLSEIQVRDDLRSWNINV